MLLFDAYATDGLVTDGLERLRGMYSDCDFNCVTHSGCKFVTNKCAVYQLNERASFYKQKCDFWSDLWVRLSRSRRDWVRTALRNLVQKP